MSSPTEEEILVGFLCPICKTNLECEELLLAHYVTHKEDDYDCEPVTPRRFDVRNSMSKLFDKAMELKRNSFELIFGSGSGENRRPATISEAELRSKDLLELFTGQKDEEKVKLSSRSHTDHLLEKRSAKIKGAGKETDRILNNLKKYLYEKSDKSLWKKLTHEDSIETEAKYCSKCKKSFKLSRRKRHCKLCEAALCDDCSVYLEANIAESIVNKSEETSLIEILKPLRHCEDCNLHLKVIKARSNEEEADTKLIESYKEMHNLKRQLSQTVVTYKEIYESLRKGKTIHSLSQAVIVRDHIAQRGREIKLLGKRVAEIPAEEGTRTARLLASIQKATDDFVEELLALSKPPTQKEIEEARLRRLSDNYLRSLESLEAKINIAVN